MIDQTFSPSSGELSHLADGLRNLNGLFVGVSLVKGMMPAPSHAIALSHSLFTKGRFCSRNWGALSGEHKENLRGLCADLRSLHKSVSEVPISYGLFLTFASSFRWPFTLLLANTGLNFARTFEVLIKADDDRAKERWERFAKLNEFSERLDIGPSTYDPSKTVKRDLEKVPRRTV